jgi:hypothetical protein
MAVIPYTLLDVPHLGKVQAVEWVLTGSDTGQPLIAPHMSDKSVQIYATEGGGFGAGSLAIEGALHHAVPWWDVLDDSHGIPLLGITSSRIKSIEENTTLLRPVATSVASVTIIILMSALHLSSL